MYNSNVVPVNYGTRHFYSLTVVGAGKTKESENLYFSRQDAEKNMFKLLRKFNINIVKEYEDKHDRTYVCNNNVCFYIQRYC